ncbi:activating signal cointegrator 1 complex subunit 1-like isoform X2 [Onthophagus taurus]|uniref:activating signal cointegrator 1 complex subunit 1-like isoform X2 n=1 Tax=Onthophagus taurus TaxID=166361 RepID=UPI000C2000BD|nr:activating signal cointegrator 1 complex subunit 1-like isoform X2 [Onthophagus taurus]
MYTKRMSKIAKFMETVKPSRIWIDGKCHEVQKYNKNAKEVIATEECRERFRREYNINVVEDRFHTSFKLALPYYKKIHSYRKITVKDLEKDTGAEIKIPTEGVEEKIIIKGPILDDVINARLKLQSLISTIRDQQPAMQFVGIPTQCEEIRGNFEKFKETLLADENNIKGMDPTIFQKPERLHLTVAVFALMDSMEVLQAINILNDCKSH